MERTRIRIGNQTAWTAPSLMAPFEYAVANGFDAFEWFPDRGWDERDIDLRTREQIRATALRHDIRLSVHAPWRLNPLEAEARPLLDRSLDFAREIGADLLNLHLFADEGIAAYLDAIAPLIPRLQGIRLAIENTPLTAPACFNEFFARLRELHPDGADHVGMCLDIGHANLCPSTRNDFLRYLGELDPQAPIIHVHLHENWGDRDSHLTAFTGPSARDSTGIEILLERLIKRDFSGSIILEQWPDPPSLLTVARERLGRMLGEVLSPPAEYEDGFLDALVEHNRHSRSWREKLESVRDLLADQTRELTAGELVYLAVYLRFLGTGEVACIEDGRHFRPNHAAQASGAIQDRLAGIADPEKAFVLRKIYPWLPSSDGAFMRAEPLTRIRDIAHRNDVPQELKREIKNTLQNKLHRCAGPEDLVTSAAILERITAPGASYSREFVEQFKIFHEELREFFNARSLEEQLRAIADRASGPETRLIRKFLAEKEGGADPLILLRRLADLRRALYRAEGEPRLADIALESFAFVVLSRIVNSLEKLPWDQLLEALRLTIVNVSLGGLASAECRAIEAELTAWSGSFAPSDRDQLLRLKATLDRSRRLAEEYSDRMLSLFPSRVAKLGHALGVADHAIHAYVEGDIRGHIVFQLSKLASGMSGNIRRLAQLPPGDVLVSGRAVGRVVSGLSDSSVAPVLALLKNAQGDEEIPAGVRGIVLANEIPHLSHLGVRARQGNVIFATCEDGEKFTALRHFIGKWAVLQADPQGFTLEPSSAPADPKVEYRPGRARVPDVCLKSDSRCLPFAQVTRENGGDKAAGARRLEALSYRSGGAFQTPPGLVVPFAVMAEALRSVPRVEAEYNELISGLNGSDCTRVAERLRELVAQIPVPEEIAGTVALTLDMSARGVMVRSSANCEDLAELAGAGLYDSVANVRREAIGDAVRKVWASLWTERAVLSRNQGGIPHRKAHMAVLIQQMVVPEYAFIMHTANPISGNRDEVYIELAVGLGEALASAAVPGSPYRLVFSKSSGETRILAFASFSNAIRPDSSGGIVKSVVQYSDVRLSFDPGFTRTLGMRLAAIGRFVEEAFGRPQDIEGVVAGDAIYLVQARAQQGLLPSE